MLQNDKYKSRLTGPHTPLLYKIYSTPVNIEKVLVASFKMASVSSFTKLYLLLRLVDFKLDPFKLSLIR